MNSTLTVPEHATHVVCNSLGDIVAWGTSEAIAVAVAKRHGPGAYVATNVAWSEEEANRKEALRELEALNATEDPAEAFERVLVQAGLEPTAQVTHAVELEAPAKLVVGFTAGGFLAKRSRTALRKAGIPLPKRISERTVANAIRTSGFEPVIVPASTL